jgi:hypothetical protein
MLKIIGTRQAWPGRRAFYFEYCHSPRTTYFGGYKSIVVRGIGFVKYF